MKMKTYIYISDGGEVASVQPDSWHSGQRLHTANKAERMQ